MIAFFDAVVDINSNKLELAVSTYIQNDWFLSRARIYSDLGDLLLYPLIDLLGIDGRGSEMEKANKNWAGVRSFFKRKLSELNQARDDAKTADDGQNKLLAAVLDEVMDTLERQLSEMSYFQMSNTDSLTAIDEHKLKHAPLTNLGCESEFAKLFVRVTASGGTTSVQTHLRKSMISTNLLLEDPSFTQLSTMEKGNSGNGQGHRKMLWL